MADDETKVVDLDVGGGDPVSQVKAMLGGYDINGEVSRIAIQVFERDEAAENDTDPDDGSNDTTASGRLTEADRSLAGVEPDSTYHLVLAAIDSLNATRVDRDDVAEPLGVPPKNVSTTMSKLFRRRLLDRNDDVTPYQYYLTKHGEAMLDELGRDADPDDVGGVWADG